MALATIPVWRVAIEAKPVMRDEVVGSGPSLKMLRLKSIILLKAKRAGSAQGRLWRGEKGDGRKRKAAARGRKGAAEGPALVGRFHARSTLFRRLHSVVCGFKTFKGELLNAKRARYEVLSPSISSKLSLAYRARERYYWRYRYMYRLYAYARLERGLLEIS